MPKWLSSAMIFIGFLALIVLAIVPRNVEVTVISPVRDVINHNAPGHNGPVPDGEEGAPADDGGE